MNSHITSLGKVTIEGVEHDQILRINASGEIGIVSLNLRTGGQQEFMLDAVAADNLYEALGKFHRGDFDEVFDEAP
jgi:hypothetical protein